MNPTATSDPTIPPPNALVAPAIDPALESGGSGAALTPPEADAFNPVLMRLKQEAEDDVKRLRAELSQARNKLLEYDLIEEKAKAVDSSFDSRPAQRLRAQLPTPHAWEELRKVQARLEAELAQAERRLETELAAIRQHELATPVAGGRLSRARREMADLFEAGMRVLNDYTAKLDRLVASAVTIWSQRAKEGGKYRKDPKGAVEYELDSFLQSVLSRLGDEFLALSEPLRWWIARLSAVHEEGRLTDVQRMELRLRLSELESKFQTANVLLAQLNVL